ncbi:hypothetical protein AKJ43_02460 [candidate division MSBL1 archaeon SCGC-AAA261D19]|uniref:Uncharacterized protein n=1 Tax=candidate division MSBL1 archaeon SCGC-AAA261D19 TaxID=1698273 RepID=A0A133V6Q1_9EURY|nr:hypothetical protein AKJ43_02460 [candidate division MSBL1 archaeon SCGC-AAA261D19]
MKMTGSRGWSGGSRKRWKDRGSDLEGFGHINMNYRELKELARRVDQAEGEERRQLVERLIEELLGR